MTSSDGGAARAPGADAPDDERTVTMERPELDVQPSRPARREPILLQGIGPALLAVVLALTAVLGTAPFAVAVLVAQVLLVLGLLALLDAPGSGGAFVVAVAAAVAADAVVLLSGEGAAGLAGVMGLTLVAALLHQLSRSTRNRVTESLADTLVVALSAVAAACLLALERLDGGHEPVLVALGTVGATLLVARVTDAVLPRPPLAPRATRGWPGLVLGLVAGAGAGLLVAQLSGPTSLPGPPAVLVDLTARSAALLGLAVAATVATADLVVDLAAAELRRGWRDARRAAAVRPSTLLLPFALAGPVALLAGRLVLP